MRLFRAATFLLLSWSCNPIACTNPGATVPSGSTTASSGTGPFNHPILKGLLEDVTVQKIATTNSSSKRLLQTSTIETSNPTATPTSISTPSGTQTGTLRGTVGGTHTIAPTGTHTGTQTGTPTKSGTLTGTLRGSPTSAPTGTQTGTPAQAGTPTSAPTQVGTPTRTVSTALMETSGSPTAFTIIFISDMETEYRHHSVDFCKNVVGYIKDLAGKGLKYDAPFDTVQINPDFVIHGGDISDGVYGTWTKQGSSAADYIYSNVWQQLYDAGIPMISSLGNHDIGNYSPTTHEQANKFVSDSYTKTMNLLSGNTIANFNYAAYTSSPSDPQHQALYIANFRGVQIANLNNRAFFQDPDGTQLAAFSAAIDKSKKTVFTSHYPLSKYASEGAVSETRVMDVINMISNMPKTALLSGHVHERGTTVYSGFTDYTAAYPHPWEVVTGSGTYAPPGMYAVYVDPTLGVLQVKNIEIPYQQITNCSPDGTVCGIGTTCNSCCHENRNADMTQCGGPKWPDGTICALGTTCDACLNTETYWYSKAFNSCGSEPKWPDGTICALGTTCNACQNPATYWPGKVITACGNEPCWTKGTLCGCGTTCNSCCSGAACEWWRFGLGSCN